MAMGEHMLTVVADELRLMSSRLRVPVNDAWKQRFHVRPLTRDDLPSITWAGPPTHLRHVAAELDRVASGDVVYLAVCGQTDVPLAIGMVDFARRPSAGDLEQLVTMPAVRSLGLGSKLVRALEAAIRERGLTRAMLNVEGDNERALGLYERLGYRVMGREALEWDQENARGQIERYHTNAWLMEHDLE